MRVVIVFVLLSCIVFSAFGQAAAIQLDKENILYLGFYSPMTVAVENCRSNLISLTTDNGTIRKDTNTVGHYIILPTKVGIAHVQIIRTDNNKVIDNKIFRVRRIPVTPSLSGHYFGDIPAKIVAVAIAPAAIVEGMEMNARLPIISFTIVVSRGSKEVFRRNLQDSNGTRIDDVSRQFFRKLENGDKLIIDDIISKDLDGSKRPLPPMHFTIINAEELKDLPIEKHEPRLLVDPVTGDETWEK